MCPPDTSLARYCRADGFDADYPEKYLPAELLTRLNDEHEWRDGQWWWGWNSLHATRTDTGAPKIAVANIPWGAGYHTVKYWLPEQGCFVDETFG